TGAEGALVVNNCAAAVLLAAAALAGDGREVVVSRGQLIEIGGSFRIPEVVAQSGAMLREVGTTNRTRLLDFAAALGDATGAILGARAARPRCSRCWKPSGVCCRRAPSGWRGQSAARSWRQWRRSVAARCRCSS